MILVLKKEMRLLRSQWGGLSKHIAPTLKVVLPNADEVENYFHKTFKIRY